MARKSAPPIAPARFPADSKKAKPRRRLNVRAWAKDRIKGDKAELQMWDGIAGFVALNQRKLRKKITHEEKDLLAPAPVAPDFPMKVAPARAKK